MTFGSLFAGIGGFDLGFERAGMQCLWQVEKDDWCRSKLAKHWPDVKRYEDVCDVGKHNLRTVDVICGGFPCQDVSIAGKQAGIGEGTRSGLWSQFHRIISELRPRYAVLENVSNLLSGPKWKRGQWFGRILGDLAEIGYDAEWEVLPASAFGAPHERERAFIVAHPNGEWELQQERCEQNKWGWIGDCIEADFTTNIASHRCRQVEQDERRTTSGERPTRSVGELFRPIRKSTWWAIEPDVVRLVYGIPNQVDRVRGCGNAVVPQIAEYIGQCLVLHNEAIFNDVA